MEREREREAVTDQVVRAVGLGQQRVGQGGTAVGVSGSLHVEPGLGEVRETRLRHLHVVTLHAGDVICTAVRGALL